MKKLFTILAAMCFVGSMMAATATMQYNGTTTTNMADGANNAAIVSLDANLFNVVSDKGSTNNHIGLNKAGTIRLYAHKDSGNGNILTVTILDGTIDAITLDVAQTATFEVKAGENVVTATEGTTYAIGATSFVIQNKTQGATTQLHLNKIDITYTSSTSTPEQPADTTVTPEVKEFYNVAEAIAAYDKGELKKNDFVSVKGVVTKMDIKPTNFVKYGSVNIYLADATGAAGEFELYNCYSLEKDTFATTDPTFDATSTSWLSLTAATDRNGKTVNVGDTVIGYGKITLFNTTYELNTGCYLTSVKSPAPAATVVTVENTSVLEMAQNLVLQGVFGERNLTISLWQGGDTQGFGTYSGTGEADYNGSITNPYAELTAVGDATYTDNGNGTFTFKAIMTDGTAQYDITMNGLIPAKEEPQPVATWDEIVFTEVAAKGSLNDSIFTSATNAAFTLTVTDTDASKVEVDANTASFGTAEENATYTFRLKTGGKSSAKNVLTLAIPADGKLRIAARPGSKDATDRNIVVKQGETELYNQVVLEEKVGDYYSYVLVDVKQGTVTIEYPVNSLFLYAFGFQAVAGPTVGFENIEAAEKAVKFIENGQIFILRDGAVYNLMGARVK